MGHPLPPCIVMERGESLDKWQARAKPDRMQACSVRKAPPFPETQPLLQFPVVTTVLFESHLSNRILRKCERAEVTTNTMG